MTIMRRIAGQMYQIEQVDLNIVPNETIVIKIEESDPGDFECDVDPPHYLEVGPGGSRTPMDVDLSKFHLAPGAFVKIVIELDDDDIRFIPDDATGRFCVTAGSPDAALDFWNLELSDADPNRPGYHRTVSFICRISDEVGSIHAYNVGVVFLSRSDPTHEFPVIYDPKVRNDGG